MTIMSTGLGLLFAGLALIRHARPERRAIQAALTRRLRSGIGLVAGGILLILIGARVQGQIWFRRWKRSHRAQIDELRGPFERVRPLVDAVAERARQR